MMVWCVDVDTAEADAQLPLGREPCTWYGQVEKGFQANIIESFAHKEYCHRE